MIPYIVYLGIGLLIFVFVLFTNMINPNIEDDDFNMLVVSWICIFLLSVILWPIIAVMVFFIFKAKQEKILHKYISGYGLIKITEIFENHNEPIMFSAKSKQGDLFIGILVEDNEDIKQYWYLPLSKHRLGLLKEGKMDLRDAILHSEGEKILSVLRDKVTKNEYNEWVHYNDLPASVLCRMGVVYLGKINKGV